MSSQKHDRGVIDHVRTRNSSGRHALRPYRQDMILISSPGVGPHAAI